jgi:surface protein
MSGMFSGCSSLKELNVSNFNTNNVTYISGMFSGCTDIFQNKIKAQYKNIKIEAFY